MRAETDAGHHWRDGSVEALHFHDGVGPICGVPGGRPVASKVMMKSLGVVILLVFIQCGHLPGRGVTLAQLGVDRHLVAGRLQSCLIGARARKSGERRGPTRPQQQ